MESLEVSKGRMALGATRTWITKSYGGIVIC